MADVDAAYAPKLSVSSKHDQDIWKQHLKHINVTQDRFWMTFNSPEVEKQFKVYNSKTSVFRWKKGVWLGAIFWLFFSIYSIVDWQYGNHSDEQRDRLKVAMIIRWVQLPFLLGYALIGQFESKLPAPLNRYRGYYQWGGLAFLVWMYVGYVPYLIITRNKFAPSSWYIVTAAFCFVVRPRFPVGLVFTCIVVIFYQLTWFFPGIWASGDLGIHIFAWVVISIVGVLYIRLSERRERGYFLRLMSAAEQQRGLIGERKRADALLLNMLPASVAEELKDGPRLISQKYDSVTVLFSDIAGFTSFSSKTDPQLLVEYLDCMFSAFDHLTTVHRVEKIKTIGDAYVAVAGAPDITSPADQARRMIKFATDMHKSLEELRETYNISWTMRIGIHTGPLVGGVVGIQKFCFDVFGETVFIAEKMEQTGIPGRVHISSATHALVQDVEEFTFERRSEPVEYEGSIFQSYLVTAQAGKKRSSSIALSVPSAKMLTKLTEEMNPIAAQDYDEDVLHGIIQASRLKGKTNKLTMVFEGEYEDHESRFARWYVVEYGWLVKYRMALALFYFLNILVIMLIKTSGEGGVALWLLITTGVVAILDGILIAVLRFRPHTLANDRVRPLYELSAATMILAVTLAFVYESNTDEMEVLNDMVSTGFFLLVVYAATIQFVLSPTLCAYAFLMTLTWVGVKLGSEAGLRALQIGTLVLCAGIAVYVALSLDRTFRKDYFLNSLLEARSVEADRQITRTKQLVYNMIPRNIFFRLKKNPGQRIADHCPTAVIMFVELYGFKKIALDLTAKDTVKLLNEVFEGFDRIALRREVDRVKTISAVYMAASGINTGTISTRCVQRVAHMALEVMSYITRMNEREFSSWPKLQVRIGINAGPVVSGVVGSKKIVFDVWGDTVNLASRMESNAEPGCIQVSEAVHQQLRSAFKLSYRGTVPMKGKGDVRAYYLDSAIHGMKAISASAANEPAAAATQLYETAADRGHETDPEESSTDSGYPTLAFRDWGRDDLSSDSDRDRYSYQDPSRQQGRRSVAPYNGYDANYHSQRDSDDYHGYRDY